MNWADLSFGYVKTDYNVRCYYRDGKWGELEVSSSEIINIHMAATCLHYGQEAFEGLKAFRGKDGKVRVFRMDENAKRLQSSSRGIKMAEFPVEKFEEAVRKVVKLNERFVPPYESGASLYIRPLLIGLGAQVGVKPAPEYLFVVFVTPVGPYFKGGFQPSKVCIMREYDHHARIRPRSSTGNRYNQGWRKLCGQPRGRRESARSGLCRRALSGPERKEISGRMRAGQLLRSAW